MQVKVIWQVRGHPVLILTKFDIKLDGLSMIQKDIGRAMSFTKYRARRAASSMIFLKLIARSISLSIVRKNPSNFIIIMFKIRYFCILTDITDRYYCISVSWEHNNGCNRVRHRRATAKCQSLLTDRWKDGRKDTQKSPYYRLDLAIRQKA